MKSNKSGAGAGSGDEKKGTEAQKSSDSTKVEDALLNLITCPIMHFIFRRPVQLTSGTIVEQEAADIFFGRNPGALECPKHIPISMHTII
jgi:hypothetical protein